MNCSTPVDILPSVVEISAHSKQSMPDISTGVAARCTLTIRIRAQPLVLEIVHSASYLSIKKVFLFAVSSTLSQTLSRHGCCRSTEFPFLSNLGRAPSKR